MKLKWGGIEIELRRETDEERDARKVAKLVETIQKRREAEKEQK